VYIQYKIDSTTTDSGEKKHRARDKDVPEHAGALCQIFSGTNAIRCLSDRDPAVVVIKFNDDIRSRLNVRRHRREAALARLEVRALSFEEYSSAWPHTDIRPCIPSRSQSSARRAQGRLWWQLRHLLRRARGSAGGRWKPMGCEETSGYLGTGYAH
jgi:hypothetical protein